MSQALISPGDRKTVSVPVPGSALPVSAGAVQSYLPALCSSGAVFQSLPTPFRRQSDIPEASPAIWHLRFRSEGAFRLLLLFGSASVPAWYRIAEHFLSPKHADSKVK